jgi:alkylation response protein AidB-like acyl-CoA dehydrogenase
MCAGGCRIAIGESARYAAQRKQFGQPIASFGAIKHKIGEMIVRTYAIESLLYRTAGMIDARIERDAHPGESSAALAALEEYAIEASIAKVACSEILNDVLDENVQIHGGNGFVRDYPAERHYRDARVNRIFEGTNEINRLLAGGMLARRAARGDLAVIAAARQLQDELLGPLSPAPPDDSVLGSERHSVEAFKKATLMIVGLAMQTYGQKLADEQEVLMYIADLLIDVYSADSAVLRAQAAGSSASGRPSFHADAARVFVRDAALRIETCARQALAAMLEGDALRAALAGLRRLLKTVPVNTVSIRRRLADEAVVRGGYPL